MKSALLFLILVTITLSTSFTSISYYSTCSFGIPTSTLGCLLVVQCCQKKVTLYPSPILEKVLIQDVSPHRQKAQGNCCIDGHICEVGNSGKYGCHTLSDLCLVLLPDLMLPEQTLPPTLSLLSLLTVLFIFSSTLFFIRDSFSSLSGMSAQLSSILFRNSEEDFGSTLSESSSYSKSSFLRTVARSIVRWLESSSKLAPGMLSTILCEATFSTCSNFLAALEAIFCSNLI